jgi:L-ascorbate metabolism protein UlaG (beta-lactamase superfamily)
MLLGTFICLLIVGLAYYFLAVRVQLGRNPEGQRLSRISKSENYQNEQFQNRVATPMDFPFGKVMKETMKKGVDRTPNAPIETLPINLKAYAEDTTAKVSITWLGHSTVLLRINNKTILIDPVFSKRASFSNYFGPKKFDYTYDYSLENLPEIDLVLLSHDHYDHLDYAVIKALKNKVSQFIMPLGVGSHLEFWGVNALKIKELDWWESINIDGLEFTATPTRHFTGRGLQRFKTFWCGWAIRSEQANIFYSGDSGYFDGFKEIGDKLGPFDLAFIECGQYSKYWSTIHLMPEESVQVALDVKSKVAIPIHWGKFKLSIHSWYEPPMRFLQRAKDLNQGVAIPQIGETFTIDSIPVVNHWFK